MRSTRPLAKDVEPFTHSHAFGTLQSRPGENKPRWVIALTSVKMIADLVAGTVFGSMALLADGWHMATHAAALGITAFAYAYARKRAHDPRFTFGTGKVGALGGFGSAVSLGVVSVMVLLESAHRLMEPVTIQFDEAIGVAVVGLAVNLLSALLLKDHEHEHGTAATARHHDHNLRGAYLHVLADAFTSVMAIAALSLGQAFGWAWMDAATGILGSVVIARWSIGLLRESGTVLLDAEVSSERQRQVRAALEADGENRVCDLHLWRVGPRHLAAIVSVVTATPRDPHHYKRLLSGFADLSHVTVEVHDLQGGGRGTRTHPQAGARAE
jgi:cation diffusion facilitator family transporter